MMNWINDLIVAVDEAGLRQDAYSIINTVGLIVALLIGLANGLRLKVGIIATIVTLLAYYFLPGPIITAIMYIEDGFRITGRQNGVYIFAYIPLIGYLVSIIVRRSYKQIWDVLMVIPIARFVVARIACTITGCCSGYPSEWGVYNPVVVETLFPIQLLEAFVSLLILVYVFWREKKNKFIPDGKNVPIVLISYGIARFFLEFLHNNEKMFLNVNLMQFHCVLMIIVGVITLRIIRKSEKKFVDMTDAVKHPQ